jgi:hypothetical protein
VKTKPAKKDRTPSGQALDMEDPLDALNNLIAALMLIAEAEHGIGNIRESDALWGIANAMEDAHQDLHDIWNALLRSLKKQAVP